MTDKVGAKAMAVIWQELKNGDEEGNNAEEKYLYEFDVTVTVVGGTFEINIMLLSSFLKRCCCCCSCWCCWWCLYCWPPQNEPYIYRVVPLRVEGEVAVALLLVVVIIVLVIFVNVDDVEVTIVAVAWLLIVVLVIVCGW